MHHKTAPLFAITRTILEQGAHTMKTRLAPVVCCGLLHIAVSAGVASAGVVFDDSAQLNMHGNLAAVNFYFSDTTGGFPTGNTQVSGTIQGVSFVNLD